MNLRLLAAASAALIASAAASAALASTPTATASATADMNVTVMAPASIAKVNDMVMGTIVRPSGSGTSNTVTLDPAAGGVTITGAGNAQHAGSTNAAKFTVSGPAGTNFAASTSFTGMTGLTGFAIDAQSGAATQIGSGGTSDLFYGAHFTVSDTTTAQAYTGVLTVTINYP